MSDWDSYKWIIFVLYQFGFVKSLRRARDSDIIEALAYMKLKKQHGAVPGIHKWEGPFWRREDLQDFIQTNGEKCVIVIDNFALDITSYLLEHVCKILNSFQYSADSKFIAWGIKSSAKIFFVRREDWP